MGKEKKLSKKQRARAQRLFEDLQRRNPKDVAGFLRRHCPDDAEVRREVKRMWAERGRLDGITTLARKYVDAALSKTTFTSPPMLGPYQLDQLLGESNISDVYKAIDTRFQVSAPSIEPRIVAVKIIRSQVARFTREAAVIGTLKHPHICVLYDIQPGADPPYIVMEYVEGESLAQRLIRGPIPAAEAVRYAIQLADAMECVHERKVVHRDLKPANIMLTAAGIKLLDFGIARLLEGATHLTQNTIIGTPAYMSPEQVEGPAVDERSDIFSFGTILYEMFSGDSPFRRDTTEATYRAVQRDSPRPLWHAAHDFPVELQSAVDRCLEKRRERRFQTMQELRLALEAWQSPVELVTSEPGQSPDIVTSHCLSQATDPTAQVRLQAVKTLRERAQGNRPAIRAIVELLRDPDPDVCLEAVLAVKELQPPPSEAITNLTLLLNTRNDTSRERQRMAIFIRSEAAAALGAIGPPAKAAAPELLRRLGDNSTRVVEESSQALVSIGFGRDPLVGKALIDLVCDYSRTAAATMLDMDTSGLIPDLIDGLRRATGKHLARYADAPEAQSYLLELLLGNRDPGRNAVEQYLRNATPNEQESLARAWLDFEPKSKHRIRNLIDVPAITAIWNRALDSLQTDRVPIARPSARPNRVFDSPMFDHFAGSLRVDLNPHAIRCAAGMLLLDLEGSDQAWPVFTGALTAHNPTVAAYAATVLAHLDPAIARRAMPDIVDALGRAHDTTVSIPAICKSEWEDSPADPQGVLADTLSIVGDRTTVDMLEPLTATGSPPLVARAAERFIAAIQARLARV